MRVLQPVTDRKESMALFEALRAQASSGAVAFPNRHVGFRGRGYDCSVYWRPDERIWGLFERFSHYKRFWICWGVRYRTCGLVQPHVEFHPERTITYSGTLPGRIVKRPAGAAGRAIRISLRWRALETARCGSSRSS